MPKGAPQDPQQIETALSRVILPSGIRIRPWQPSDFPVIQQLSTAEGWVASRERPGEVLAAWHNSWPALVAVDSGSLIGFVRALSDGKVTTYVAELLIVPEWRGQGIGGALLDACHHLYPNTRLDLLSTEIADSFYEAQNFVPVSGFRRNYL